MLRNAFENLSTETKQDVQISALAAILSELSQKLEAGDSVELGATTLAALEAISTIITNFPSDYPDAAVLTKLEAMRVLLAGVIAVSGPLTNTQLRAADVSVSVSNFPSTQPVSGTVEITNDTGNAIPISATSLPLPTGAAKESGGNLDAILTELQQKLETGQAVELGPVSLAALESITATISNFPSDYPDSLVLTKLELVRLLLVSLEGKDFSTQTTLALIKAKTDNLDALLSTRTKPADQQHTIIDSGSVSVNNFPTSVDTELTVADLDTGAGSDSRAVVGIVLAESGGARLVGSANPIPISGSVAVSNTVQVDVTDEPTRDMGKVDIAQLDQYTPIAGRLPVDNSGVTQPISGTVDTELTVADLDTGAGSDSRAVVGIVLAESGGARLVGSANPVPIGGSVTVSNTVQVDVTDEPARDLGKVDIAQLDQYTPVAGRLPVDGSGVTQPVSGIVTSNQGAAGVNEWPVKDNYSAGEVLAQQTGAGAVLTFTFSAPVQLVVVEANGTSTDEARCDPFGGTPSAVLGIPCRDEIPVFIPVTVTIVKVFTPIAMIVNVWGFRH